MKSQHSFRQVESINAPRSQFNLSHPYKTTYNAGWLIPILDLAVLPGDTINCKLDFFTRMATPLHPILDNLWCDTQFFFCPDRIILDNFRKMMGEQDNPTDSIDYVYPILDPATPVQSTPEGDLTTAAGRTAALLDYIGVPTAISSADVDINCMTLRAINACYNHWYRDQNFIDSLPLNTDDGPDPSSDYELFRRGKRHDYFTSCLPYPQKSNTPVTLPLGTSAPVVGIGSADQVYVAGGVNRYESDGGTSTYPFEQVTTNPGKFYIRGTAALGGYPDIQADLSSAAAPTINAVREAIQIQRLLERDMRSGTRFPEMLSAHYGVYNFNDLTYRPMYLGGGSTPINVTPVPTTALNTFPTPNSTVGDLGAYATASSVNSNNHGFSQSFSEPGRIIGFMSVRSQYTYQQGLSRFLSKRTRYDIALPILSHLGEQEVLNKEIACTGTSTDDEIFGYQERYAEYRFCPGRISGLFRSAATASLDAWHLSQHYSTLPTLGKTFIEENPPLERCIAVPTEPHFITDMYFNIIAARPLPVFGTPGLMDHF